MEHMPWKLVDLNISAGDIDVIKNLDVMTLSLTSLDLDDFWRYDMIDIEYWDDKLYISCIYSYLQLLQIRYHIWGDLTYQNVNVTSCLAFWNELRRICMSDFSTSLSQRNTLAYDYVSFSGNTEQQVLKMGFTLKRYWRPVTS